MASIGLRKKIKDAKTERKLTVWGLVLMMVLAVFVMTGCGHSNSNDSSGDNGNDSVAAIPDDDGGSSDANDDGGTTDTGDDGSTTDTGDGGGTTDTGNDGGTSDTGDDGGAPPGGDGAPPGDGGAPPGDGGGPPGGGAPPGGGPPGGGSSSDIDKTGVYEQNGGTVTETAMTYAATQTDESAVYVYGAGIYSLSDATLTKTGDSSSVNSSNFYGNNAVVLAEDGSTINLTNCTLTTDSSGSNGAFAYEKGSVVNVTNCTISTTGNSARGVDATYGGTINIYDSDITTTGAHCSALATDRYDNASGQPVINAYNVIGEVDGDGSCGIYSTGIFYVEDSTLTANGSGAAVIEGTNSITLVNTHLIVTDLYSREDKYGVMVYQSMSGDALGNTGTLDMTGGSITVDGGPYLLNTNDEAYFTLEEVALDGSDIILKTGKYDWHATATNGGISHLTTYNQAMVGDFIVDSYGNITAALSDGSSLVGAIDSDNSTNLNGSGETEGGYVSLTLDSTSTWTATADSWVDELEGVELSGGVPVNVDAASGVTIYYGSGTGLSGSYTLSSGGQLQAL
jgi:hypothetical protein